METVTLTRSQVNMLEVVEMKILRFSVGMTSKNRVRCGKVWEALGVAYKECKRMTNQEVRAS